MKSDKFHLILQTNSPGEISAWVNPIVSSFKSECPDGSVSVFIVPCQYASGKEVEIAEGIFGVDEVFSVKESVQSILTFFVRKPKSKGAVLFLGGDPFYAQLLGFKYRFPVFGYTQGKKTLGRFYKKTFFSSEGDLMSAKVFQYRLKQNQNVSKEKNIDILFFPGSRPQHFEALLPMMGDIIRAISVRHSDYCIKVAISPFVNDGLRDKVIKQAGVEGYVINGDQSLDLLNRTNLLVTLPGTNTAEAMYMGVPMAVLMLLNRPDVIIFDGLLGLIGRIPVLGTLLKRLVIFIAKRTPRYYSKPNQLANRPIVKEVFGLLNSEQIVSELLPLIETPSLRRNQKTELDKLYPSEDVSLKIIKEILALSSLH